MAQMELRAHRTFVFTDALMTFVFIFSRNDLENIIGQKRPGSSRPVVRPHVQPERTSSPPGYTPPSWSDMNDYGTDIYYKYSTHTFPLMFIKGKKSNNYSCH